MKKLTVSTEFPHFTLAGVLMGFIIHFNIILGFAPKLVQIEERRISTFKNIDIWVRESGVTVHVQLSISLANMQRPVNPD
jgi:hypothetical protein